MNRRFLPLAICALITVGHPQPAAADLGWLPMDGLPPLEYASATYDPVHDQVLVYGGMSTSALLSDLWVRSMSPGSNWQRVSAPNAPLLGRYGHAAVYDPVRQRMLVVGGYTTFGPKMDVWALSLSGTPSWTQILPAGTAPYPRSYHTLTYDPVRDRLILIGGLGGLYRNDVWELTLGGTPTWNQLSPSGTPPSGRYGHAVAYDPVRDVMILTGGLDSYGVIRDDVWRLSLNGTPAWTRLYPSGTPPVAVHSHTLQYDPDGDRMVQFGGRTSTSYSNELMALSLGAAPAWTDLTPPAGPSARSEHASAYDPVRRKLVVVGGRGGSYLTDNAWELSLDSTTWGYPGVLGPPPPRRQDHVLVLDSNSDRIIVHGGTYGGDVWALPLSGGGSWTQIIPAGIYPGPRSRHMGAYDPVRDRLVFAGGWNGSACTQQTWELSLGDEPTWRLLPTLLPVPLCSAAMAYVPGLDRFYAYGGDPPKLYVMNAASDGPWSIVPTSGTPHPMGHELTMTCDPTRGQLIFYGGSNGFGARTDETRALDLATGVWTQIVTGATVPPHRLRHVAVLDSQRDRLVIYGGIESYDNWTPYTDMWALSLSGPPEWTQLSPPPPGPPARNTTEGVYDPTRDRIVFFGGGSWAQEFNDTWAMYFAGLVDVAPAPRPGRISLAPGRPNPSSAAVTIPFAIPVHGDARMEIVDISGRVVRSYGLADLAPGSHSIVWDGADAGGRRAPPGIYFSRLSFQGEVSTGRIVRLR